MNEKSKNGICGFLLRREWKLTDLNQFDLESILLHLGFRNLEDLGYSNELLAEIINAILGYNGIEMDGGFSFYVAPRLHDECRIPKRDYEATYG